MATSTQRRHTHGMIAGFIATVVLSMLMLMKEHMGVMPQLNPIKMLSDMAQSPTPAVGWALHFLIGTVLWGVSFGWIAPRLWGSYWWRGILFSLGPWVLMMVVLMPMAGAGLFGLALGLGAPVMTFMLHLIYGAVLGGVYGALCHGLHFGSHGTASHT